MNRPSASSPTASTRLLLAGLLLAVCSAAGAARVAGQNFDERLRLADADLAKPVDVQALQQVLRQGGVHPQPASTSATATT